MRDANERENLDAMKRLSGLDGLRLNMFRKWGERNRNISSLLLKENIERRYVS
jgi:hypothetical protein